MLKTPPTPDPWHSPKAEQKAEDIQGDVSQQSIIGDNNNQEQNQNVDPKEGNRDNQDSPAIPIINQQGLVGNRNNQNQNSITNVINLNVDDLLGKDVSKKTDQKQVILDPTKPLPQKPRNLPAVNLDGLFDYCKKLKEDSLIIVSCSDSSAALSVAYNLTDNILISNKRLFTE